MHYFWFIPVFVVILGGVWVLYLVVARRLADNPDRSVEGALAVEREEDAVVALRSGAPPSPPSE
jgi:hypothetical protein